MGGNPILIRAACEGKQEEDTHLADDVASFDATALQLLNLTLLKISQTT